MRLFARFLNQSKNVNDFLVTRKTLLFLRTVTATTTTGGLNSCTFHWQSFGSLQAINAQSDKIKSDSRTKAGSQVDNSKLVILHCPPRVRTLPSGSPFVIKLWTYLQMADIPHKVSTKTPFGPTGKTPWITVDGQNIHDSQVIIEHLGKKFDINFGKVYTAEQLAVARAVRIMMEDHLLWVALYWRTGEGLHDAETKVFKLSKNPIIRFYFRYILMARMRRQCWAQGMGRHTKEQVMEFGIQDLRTVSQILGNKKFICGDTPCEEDCGIFGVLAQGYFAESPFRKLMDDDFTNIKEYCERMKSTIWKDNWDKNLAR